MNTTQTKHTSGPWHVIPDPAWVGRHPCRDARFVATCDFSCIEYQLADGEGKGRPWRFESEKDSIICTMPDVENQKANARLIAAAPELLSALKIAIAYIYGSKAKSGVQISSVKADLDICMSAIAKATGGAS